MTAMADVPTIKVVFLEQQLTIRYYHLLAYLSQRKIVTVSHENMADNLKMISNSNLCLRYTCIRGFYPITPGQ
jgi:hypothetical protein